MKLSLNATGVLAVAGVGLAVLAAWKLYRVGGEVAAAAADVARHELNPGSDRNLAYRGVNAIGAAATGDDAFSLGSWLYDLTHADEGRQAEAPSPLNGYGPAMDDGRTGSW